MNSKECPECHNCSPDNAVSCYSCGTEFQEPTIRKESTEWVINPKYLELVERELSEAKRHRDEWLWINSVALSVLKGTPGWETAKEYADFGDGLVECELIKLAKLAREAIEFHKEWTFDSSLEKWFPLTAQELAKLKAEKQAHKEGAKQRDT